LRENGDFIDKIDDYVHIIFNLKISHPLVVFGNIKKSIYQQKKYIIYLSPVNENDIYIQIQNGCMEKNMEICEGFINVREYFSPKFFHPLFHSILRISKLTNLDVLLNEIKEYENIG
jgi:hypothetical protein